MSILTKLPIELLLSITNLCSTSDVKHLCEACHVLCDRLVSVPSLSQHCGLSLQSQLPELYCVVDLSSHNEDFGCEPWQHDTWETPALPTYSERVWEDFDRQAFARQKLFIDTIQGGSLHAIHVRKIHWTVLDTSGRSFGNRAKPDSDDESENEKLPLYVPEDGIQSFLQISAYL